jgi:hypothetical protein
MTAIQLKEAIEYARGIWQQFVISEGQQLPVPQDYYKRWNAKNFTGTLFAGQPVDVLKNLLNGSLLNPGNLLNNLLNLGRAVGQFSFLELYDVDARLLFRDFTAQFKDQDNEVMELRVRTAASDGLGVPVISIGVNEPLPIENWIKKARAIATKRKLDPIKGPRGIVCYSYPKLGLLCRDNGLQRWVIDLADQTVIPVNSGGATQEEGIGIPPSPLDDAEQRGEEVDGDHQGNSPPTTEELHFVQNVELIAQETENFCAAASAQMILRSLITGFPTTQQQIAQSMHIGPYPRDNGATLQEQQVGYLTEARTQGTSVTVEIIERQQQGITDQILFDRIRHTIDGGRPVKAGNDCHAWVLSGWKIGSGGPSVYRNDPYPPPSMDRPKGGTQHWDVFPGPSLRIVRNLMLVRRV